MGKVELLEQLRSSVAEEIVSLLEDYKPGDCYDETLRKTLQKVHDDLEFSIAVIKSRG